MSIFSKISAPNDPKVTTNTTKMKVRQTRDTNTLSPNFQPFLLHDQPFLSYGTFWKSAPNNPKKTLNITRSKVPQNMSY